MDPKQLVLLKSLWLQTLCNLLLWILCLSWGLWGRSWLHFETSWRDLGLILEPLGGVLAASWGLRYLASRSLGYLASLRSFQEVPQRTQDRPQRRQDKHKIQRSRLQSVCNQAGCQDVVKWVPRAAQDAHKTLPRHPQEVPR